MPRNPNSGRKPGRPPKKIAPDVATLVADLAGLGHSQNEIAILLGIDPKTVEARFSKEYASGKEQGKSKLRVKLVALALGGNIQALIFSLKNLAGFSDKNALEVSTPPGSPFVIDDARAKLASLVSGIAGKQSTPAGDQPAK